MRALDPGIGEVPNDWALKPDAIGGGASRSDSCSSPRTIATRISTDIGVYNSHVAGRTPAGGHAAIRAYSAGFRVLASTEAVDARDNTATTGTGVPIYWLNGNKLADNYADLYDGSWDDEVNPKNQHGNPDVGRRISGPDPNNNGTERFHSGGNP